MMSAEITLGAVPQLGAERALFGDFTPASFDVSGDGLRFLVVLEPEGKTEEPLTVVQNWQMGLKNQPDRMLYIPFRKPCCAASYPARLVSEQIDDFRSGRK
jgi:hypothetical protein